MGVTIIGATSDTLEQAQGIANTDLGLTYQLAYGVTKEDADLMGSWWSEDREGYIQPTEFIIGQGGVVLGAVYASGPIGHMGVDEVIRMITNRERRRKLETPAI